MPNSIVDTLYYHQLDDGRIQCDLCPRYCQLKNGQKGLCFVRECQNNKIVLTTYGRSSGFCIDPVEKKPLNHFYPGSAVFSYGTAGCNLSCSFCQNWDVSKSREVDTLSQQAYPQDIALVAKKHQCSSVAYTYNDPVIFHEYVYDTARACRDIGIKNIAVTAGYIGAAARVDFFKYIDAANVDLKAFSEKFYRKFCAGHLDVVLDTLNFIKHETKIWLELTVLLIPGENDSLHELDAMSKWVVDNLGTDVPMHFSAFHPDWKMLNYPRTPLSTLMRARQTALDNGVLFAYTGNVANTDGSSTCCPQCGQILITRNCYVLGEWNLSKQGHCLKCGYQLPGVFSDSKGNWGDRRLPVNMQYELSDINHSDHKQLF